VEDALVDNEVDRRLFEESEGDERNDDNLPHNNSFSNQNHSE
jgi:hypothetical protein